REPEQPDRHDLSPRGLARVPRPPAGAPARGRRRGLRRVRGGPRVPDTIRERGDGRVPVLSLRTFSKLYGLAGLRIGYGVAAAASSCGRWPSTASPGTCA